MFSSPLPLQIAVLVLIAVFLLRVVLLAWLLVLRSLDLCVLFVVPMFDIIIIVCLCVS